ncbi:MAG: polyphosphate kinase 2 [Alphaproteobacteria bacterium]|nr:polyphosphate kinase 2 [Alphaproteobacteria bacterium]
MAASKRGAGDDDNDNGQDGHYKKALYELQIELVKLQHRLIAEGARVLVLIEGRDSAGKDGTIKRLTEHMSPRETRVHAPGKPSDREETEWYFQRFAPFLPAAQEFVVFNRSWYNRSGVERVMKYCSSRQVENFHEMVVPFEEMLIRDGIELRKYYLDISRHEQKVRLAARRKDPLKQWKLSPVDEAAQANWQAYSQARDEMFRRTSHPHAPWRIVRADVKKTARLELIRDLLESFSYKGKSKKLARPDRSIVFPWCEVAHEEGLIAE